MKEGAFFGVFPLCRLPLDESDRGARFCTWWRFDDEPSNNLVVKVSVEKVEEAERVTPANRQPHGLLSIYRLKTELIIRSDISSSEVGREESTSNFSHIE